MTSADDIVSKHTKLLTTQVAPPPMGCWILCDVVFRLTVTSSQTQPAGSQLPLIEEDEFSFAVVDGSFSVQFGDVGQLTDALWSLHPDPQQQLTETF